VCGSQAATQINHASGTNGLMPSQKVCQGSCGSMEAPLRERPEQPQRQLEQLAIDSCAWGTLAFLSDGIGHPR
jgi:hypothetical protein